MSNEDLEQDERVKQWLRHNGLAIIAGIVIGLALIFGYKEWQAHKANVKAEAAAQYQLVQHSLRGGDQSRANSLIASLKDNHESSVYTILAVSLQAQHQLDADKPGDAVDSLRWAVAHADNERLKNLSRLRLARAQLAAGDAEAALTSLKKMPDDVYAALAQELRGDVQVELQHTDAAIDAYKQAFARYDDEAPQRHALRMKLENLGVSVDADSSDGGDSGHDTQDA